MGRPAKLLDVENEIRFSRGAFRGTSLVGHDRGAIEVGVEVVRCGEYRE